MAKAKKAGRYTPPKAAVKRFPSPEQTPPRREEPPSVEPDEAALLSELVTAARRVERERQRLADVVAAARGAGISWDRIGQRLGLNGETVRVRYGRR